MPEHYRYTTIKEMLPERPPVLMLDQATLDPDGRALSATKMLSANEPVFQGHFPDYPILPGVLQLAGMEQAARLLYRRLFPEQCENRLVILTCARKVRFRTTVPAGEKLTFQGKAGELQQDGSCEFEFKNLLSDGTIASSGRVLIAPKEKTWSTPAPSDEAAPLLQGKALSDRISGFAVASAIPQKFPFLQIDGFWPADTTEAPILGFKNVTASDLFVGCNTPEQYPLPLLLEANAQLACVLFAANKANSDKLGVFMGIDRAEFFRPVLPGEQIAMKVTMQQQNSFGIVQAESYVGSTLVSQAEMKFVLTEKR